MSQKPALQSLMHGAAKVSIEPKLPVFDYYLHVKSVSGDESEKYVGNCYRIAQLPHY